MEPTKMLKRTNAATKINERNKNVLRYSFSSFLMRNPSRVSDMLFDKDFKIVKLWG